LAVDASLTCFADSTAMNPPPADDRQMLAQVDPTAFCFQMLVCQQPNLVSLVLLQIAMRDLSLQIVVHFFDYESVNCSSAPIALPAFQSACPIAVVPYPRRPQRLSAAVHGALSTTASHQV